MVKYLIRFAIAVFVFFFFKITKAAQIDEALLWSSSTTIYFFYTTTVVLILWEIIERFINYFYEQNACNARHAFTVMFAKVAMVSLPFVLLSSFVFNYYVKVWVPDSCCMEIGRFWADTASGFVMSLLIIYSEIVKLSTNHAVNSAREIELVQKELIEAKYEGLKNQVNPHFLFNSFSALTALVEKDSKAAVLFIEKLSDLYRYVLEHDQNDLVSLKDELEFLDDYLYLLQMRHQHGIVVKRNINLPIENVKVPALSIQTLVENAVKHNAFSNDEPLEIIIENVGEYSIKVQNQRRPKQQYATTTKIGLKNLSNRIRLTLKKELQILEDDHTFVVELPIKINT